MGSGEFVKQKADQYRMCPSEKVWNNIHNTLHTRRRWLTIGLTLLLLTSGSVTWLMLPAGKTQPAAVAKKSPAKLDINLVANIKLPVVLLQNPSISPVNRNTVFIPN